MPIETLALIGAGGHACVAADAALLQGASDIVFFSEDRDQTGSSLMGFPIRLLDLNSVAGRYHVSIGNNAVRARLHQQLSDMGQSPVTVVHPAAVVAAASETGAGSFIAAAAILAPRSRVGVGCIINHRAVIDHDVTVGNFSHVGPGAVLGGGVTIGDGVLIGAGATILPQVSVGDGAVIGAGAVVLDDVPSGATVVGVPARQI